MDSVTQHEQAPTGGDRAIVANYAIGQLEGLLAWRDNICVILEHGEYAYTFDDITMMVIQGHLEFHEFEDCYALTQITVLPQFKLYHFFMAGGELQSMIDKVPHFEKKAKTLGCKFLSFSGRKGFEPFLRKAGFNHMYTTMWKEVA